MNQKLEDFLINDYKTISINYADLEIANASSFEKLQDGYRVNGLTKNSLLGKKPGDWKNEWYVIGSLEGNPIFIDVTDNTVYTASHGMGDWEEEKICDTLGDFKKLLDQLKSLAIGRENPVAFEKNPISKKDLMLYLSIIRKIEADEFFWMQFVETFED
jgi:hypothetical protein